MAAEFALLMPVLLVILFAIIAFGIVLSQLNVFTGAAREGARYAAVRCVPDGPPCTPDLIEDRVEAAAVGYSIGPGTPTANRDCSITSNFGEPVTVSWSQNFEIDVPLLPGSPMTLTRTVEGVFRCE